MLGQVPNFPANIRHFGSEQAQIVRPEATADQIPRRLTEVQTQHRRQQRKREQHFLVDHTKNPQGLIRRRSEHQILIVGHGHSQQNFAVMAQKLALYFARKHVGDADFSALSGGKELLFTAQVEHRVVLTLAQLGHASLASDLVVEDEALPLVDLRNPEREFVATIQAGRAEQREERAREKLLFGLLRVIFHEHLAVFHSDEERVPTHDQGDGREQALEFGQEVDFFGHQVVDAHESVVASSQKQFTGILQKNAQRNDLGTVIGESRLRIRREEGPSTFDFLFAIGKNVEDVAVACEKYQSCLQIGSDKVDGEARSVDLDTVFDV